jgi:cell division protein FtsW (lipid II flippase)
MDALYKTREVTQAWFQRNMKGDPWLWGIALFLLGGGVVVVYSASVKQAYGTLGGNTETILFKQIFLAMGAFGVMYLIHLIPYTKFVFFSRMGVWLALILLLLTFFKGVSVNDADRWVMIPIINQSFQPSEIAKIALIAHLALILAHGDDWFRVRADLPFQYFHRRPLRRHMFHDALCRQGAGALSGHHDGEFFDSLRVIGRFQNRATG